MTHPKKLRMKAGLRLAQIFLELGNTANSSYLIYICTSVYPCSLPRGIPEIEKLDCESRKEERFTSRSPDVEHLDEWDVVDPRLQVRGLWNKLDIKSVSGPPKREHTLCWIWRSMLYVFGGIEKSRGSEKGKDSRELWYGFLYHL